MEVRSPSSSNTAEKAEAKQAACLSCRKSKTRCRRGEGAVKCRKCTQANTECIVPDYRVGRKKGIKNKRDGLEKAVFRIEQALKKSKNHPDVSGDDQSTSHLQTLLAEAQGLLPRTHPDAIDPALGNHDFSLQMNNTVPMDSSNGYPPSGAPRSSAPDNDQFAVDDAENPLQLLARASDLSAPKNQTAHNRQFSNSSSIHRPLNTNRDPELAAFFGPLKPSVDTGSNTDPIELGLVTEEEASGLVAYFYEHLAHTRWGLDPSLHSLSFIRKRSSFLLTSIMAASALFIPSAAAVSKRLSAHCKSLSCQVMNNGYRSPEIVLAFMVNIPWMAPGKHWSDDATCASMSAALTIAMDISLNKLIVPSPSDSLTSLHNGREPSGCITARRALDLDGFQDIEPSSDLGRRLLRRRERIWLGLFVLDRGVCLARGRSFMVPVTLIIEHCDRWHQSALADIWDGSLVSSAVLRRDLGNLITDVKKICDGSRNMLGRGNTIAQSLQNMIDGFFNNWYKTWAFAIGGTRDNTIPPYVEILVTHGRLSIYSSVINHPTAPIEVKLFFRAAGLSSSLNVMRAAVQGESRLKSIPNNTAIMISFAACFALYLSTMGSAGNTSLTPSIRHLIEETADVLERIGSTPTHRNGVSTLYGRHLREVVGELPAKPDIPRPSQTQMSYPLPQPNGQQHAPMHPYQSQANAAPVPSLELLQFSAMSDDQINQAINDEELGNYIPDLQMDDKTGLDWLDWFNMDVNRNM